MWRINSFIVNFILVVIGVGGFGATISEHWKW